MKLTPFSGDGNLAHIAAKGNPIGLKLTPFSGDGNILSSIILIAFSLGLKLTPFSGDGNLLELKCMMRNMV